MRARSSSGAAQNASMRAGTLGSQRSAATACAPARSGA
jgi:hypothetical protein